MSLTAGSGLCGFRTHELVRNPWIKAGNQVALVLVLTLALRLSSLLATTGPLANTGKIVARKR